MNFEVKLGDRSRILGFIERGLRTNSVLIHVNGVRREFKFSII